MAVICGHQNHTFRFYLALLTEGEKYVERFGNCAKSELYTPSEEVIANANVPDYMKMREEVLKDPVGFWDALAKELIDWYEPYDGGAG